MNVVALRFADRARRLVWRIFGPRTVGIRGLVVDDAGRVLLVRHTYGPPTWHLPGGGVKRREALTEGLARELQEEVGVEVTGPLRLFGVFSNMTEGKSDHVTVFLVENWRRPDPEEAGDGEIRDAAFFAPDGIPDTTSPGSRRRVEEWTNGRIPGFRW